MEFEYGNGTVGPTPEFRTLDAIRASLMNPHCQGPSPVYSIAMGVFRKEDEVELKRRYLLFGVVAYAAGQLGDEPVRSQGHVHAVAPHSGWSPPELFEIWEGTAIIYAQESTSDDPGRCIAIRARPGEHVVVPPGWAHAVINADPTRRMIFGAWCDREYGFDYAGVRAHRGLAHFPTVTECRSMEWQPNRRYTLRPLEQRCSRSYPELGLSHEPIYLQFQRRPESVDWVAHPARLADVWAQFLP
jgi:glucose-6-phosphate isomerase